MIGVILAHHRTQSEKNGVSLYESDAFSGAWVEVDTDYDNLDLNDITSA
jgi:hypothetical protein